MIYTAKIKDILGEEIEMDETKKAYSTEKIIDEIFEKKTDYYGGGKERDNFAIPHELTVTITLSEYRKLVSEVAKKEADINDKCNELYKRDKKIEALEAQVKNLMAKVCGQSTEGKADEEK